MKILVISNLYPPDFLGGYELGCRQAVDALREAGHEVLVLTAAPRNPTPPDPGVDRRLRLIDIYDPYCEWKVRQPTRSIRYQEAYGVHAFNVHALGHAVETFRPDVAYAWNLIGLGGLGLLAALQHMGVPWVMHLMDDVPNSLCALDRDDRPVVPAIAETFTRVCRGRFICCSQTTVNEITAAGVPIGGRTRLIPNWVTTDGTPERNDYLPDGRLRVVFAGSISTHKGVDILIRAAGLLRDRGHANISIDLYGNGPDAPFRHLARSLGLDDLVRFRGPRTQRELDALYRQYDLFAFPTWAREPMAFAPLEAGGHGCAVVMSRVCGNSEWFVHGVDCFKADREPESLAGVIGSILRGELSLPDVARRGARVVLRDHHLRRILPRIESELRAAIDAGGGPTRPAAEAYRIALLAEKAFQCLIHEAVPA